MTDVVVRGGASVREHRLRNGLRVLIAERRHDPVVGVMLFYRVGSRNERAQEAGVSHFLEHMMFKGSRSFGKGEVDRLTTELGGQNNAFTGYDHTAYWFELASDRWERALDIEADRMHRLDIDEAEFDAERAVVLEELAMGEDEPWRVLERVVEESLFPRHPYGRPIIGYADTLQRMTAEDMRSYYRRFYHPGNATLVICGDVSSSAALRAARKRFASIPAGPAFEDVDPPRPPLGEPLGERRIRMSWDDGGRRLCMAWPTAAVGTHEDYVLDVVHTVLSSGRLARLHRNLVLDKGLAVMISSSNDTRVDTGVFWITAECAQGTAMEELEAAIDAEFARLADVPLTAAELKRARALMVSSEAYESEAVSDVAEHLGEYAVDADWRMALDGCERQLKVTSRQVREVVQRLLVPQRRVVGWCTPEGVQGAERPRGEAARS